MRGKSFGTELKCMCARVCAHTHLDGVWMSPRCQGYICGRVVQVGSSKYYREQQEERGREKEGVWAADAWGGGAELCRGGMQIVSMCGEDRRAELAAGRCG